MKQAINIQDTFLNQLRKEHIPVTIYLVNGFQLRGFIRGFDNFTVVIESDGKQMMVYKHAISTFTPQRPVSLMPEPPQPAQPAKQEAQQAPASES